jgi:hypothetical protein
MLYTAIDPMDTIDGSFNKLSTNSYVNDLNNRNLTIVSAGLSLGVRLDSLDIYVQNVVHSLKHNYDPSLIYTVMVEEAYALVKENE